MSAVRKPFWSELEERALFADDNITTEEAFEILDAHGIGYIAWDDKLNAQYARWLFANLE